MELGVGTDIVATARIASLIAARGTEFLSRWFTPREISYCQSKTQPALHFAARMAAKEAVAKSLQQPWDGALPWLDIEVLVDQHGAPRVRLSGEVGRVASRLDVDDIQISLSHCHEYATATAVFLRSRPGS